MDSRWFLLVITGCVLSALAEDELSTLKQAHNKNINCPSPFIPIEDRCLYFENVNEGSWDDMKTTCEVLGGDLAKLDTVEAFSGAISYIKEHGLHVFNYWVGASDAVTEGEWLWMDGSPVQRGVPLWYHCSSNTEPNGGTRENCAALMGGNYHFYMQDEQCTRVYSGICEYVAG